MAKRVIKKHDVRKNELLDVSQRLFSERGYEVTPISAILEVAGVAKGTFYHYFKSKEDLLDCLVDRITRRIVEEVRSQVTQPGLTALERLNRSFLASARWKEANWESLWAVVQPIFREENLPLRWKMNRRTRELMVPLFADIVRQGIQEGVFDTEFPEEAAGLILALGFAFQEDGFELILSLREHPEYAEIITRRTDCYRDAVERILGAPRGSLQLDAGRSLDRFQS